MNIKFLACLSLLVVASFAEGHENPDGPSEPVLTPIALKDFPAKHKACLQGCFDSLSLRFDAFTYWQNDDKAKSTTLVADYHNCLFGKTWRDGELSIDTFDLNNTGKPQKQSVRAQWLFSSKVSDWWYYENFREITLDTDCYSQLYLIGENSQISNFEWDQNSDGSEQLGGFSECITLCNYQEAIYYDPIEDWNIMTVRLDVPRNIWNAYYIQEINEWQVVLRDFERCQDSCKYKHVSQATKWEATVFDFWEEMLDDLKNYNSPDYGFIVDEELEYPMSCVMFQYLYDEEDGYRFEKWYKSGSQRENYLVEQSCFNWVLEASRFEQTYFDGEDVYQGILECQVACHENLKTAMKFEVKKANSASFLSASIALLAILALLF